jgi:hypothetical protein
VWFKEEQWAAVHGLRWLRRPVLLLVGRSFLAAAQMPAMMMGAEGC